ncbi:hypothetical protein GINT2_000303 [Glugoides intestinalis]
MLNCLIVYNQNIVNFPKNIEIKFRNRKLKVHIINNSMLGIRPNLYSVVINGRVYFQDEKIPFIGKPIEYNIKEYQQDLAGFLEKHFSCQKEAGLNKMELLRMYFALNDLGNASKVLSQMKTTGNTKMLKLILPHLKENKEPDENGKVYHTFIEICAELDMNSAVLFASEMLQEFCIKDLFRIEEDLSRLFIKDQGFKKLEVTQEPTYELFRELLSYLKLQIAKRFFARGQEKIAATMFVELAKMMCHPKDRALCVSILRKAFIMLGASADTFEGILDESMGFSFIFRPEEKFYILSTKQDKEIEEMQVNISSYMEIFEFEVEKKVIKGVFTDRICIMVIDKEMKEQKVAGIIDEHGTIHQCVSRSIFPKNSIKGKGIVLENGKYIKHQFEMEKIEMNTNLLLKKIIKLADKQNIKKEQGIVLKFEFYKDLKCNYSFYNSIDYSEEDNVVMATFEKDCKMAELCVKINDRFYENRRYYL